MRRVLKSNRPGFTLAETVVVLGLIGTLLLISIERFPTRQRQLNDETAFWQRLDTLWQQNVLIASTTGQRRLVAFSAQNREVSFNFRKDDGSYEATEVLKLPNTMRIKTHKDIQIQKNGHPQLAVVIFKSTLHPGEKQKFNALMGWGAYRVATVKDAQGFYST